MSGWFPALIGGTSTPVPWVECGQKRIFAAAFRLMADRLGLERTRRFHSHFSKIEYTEKGGEKRHLTFEDALYGPEFEPLAEQILHYDCEPVIICESAGTQAEDAARMQAIYLEMKQHLPG